MIAVDTNVLVYAHRPEFEWHARAHDLVAEIAQRRWAIPWPCVHEFYNVVTHPKIFREPTDPTGAWEQIEAWLESSGLSILAEAHDHAEQLRALTIAADARGPRVHDARIAAICLSHGVTELITMDRDFSRFPTLRTRSLLA